MSRTHAPLPSQVAVEAAIAHVLAAEADARIAVQDARAAAEARAEATRAATRAIAQRTVSRIAAARTEFDSAFARGLAAAYEEALAALQAAVARHGVEGLTVYPPGVQALATLAVTPRSVMGVRLQEADWRSDPAPAPAAVHPSPEANACRRAFVAVVVAAAPLAAVTGNLERLSLEYRRAVRRARALQDVLLPELDRTLWEVETRLEEMEQEEAISMRPRA